MKSRIPTRLHYGESRVDGEAIVRCTRSIRRGNGHNVGKVIRETAETYRGEGRGLDADFGRRLRWELDKGHSTDEAG